MKAIERDVAHHYTHGSLEHSILSGLDAPAKIGNVIAGLESGCIAPMEIIARRR